MTDLAPYPLGGANPPRLFVDIDDTLIFWKRSPGSRMIVDTWEVNMEVYEAINRFIEAHPEGSLIFWSTGGADYARKRVTEAAPELIKDRAVFLGKYPAIPFAGDTFLDDDPSNFPWKKLAIHPRNAKDLFR